jgi:hypothetical protein
VLERVRSIEMTLVLGHQTHLAHQIVFGKFRPPLGDLRIVERDIRKLPVSIPAIYLSHLMLAKATLAIVDHNLSVRSFSQRG